MTDETKLNELMKSTVDKLKNGKFNELLKIFGENYSEDDSNFILIKKTIADAMTAKGDLAEANELYMKIYDTLRVPEKLGPDHKDVLSLMADCALTSRSISIAIDLLNTGEEISIRTKNTEATDKFKVTREAIISHLTPTNRKIYDKLVQKRTEVTRVKLDTKRNGSTLPKNVVDDLMHTFGLTKYETVCIRKKKK